MTLPNEGSRRERRREAALNAKARDRKRTYERERAEVLRSLSLTKLEAFIFKWRLPRPESWLGETPLVFMHSMRMIEPSMLPIEREYSKQWLEQRGIQL